MVQSFFVPGLTEYLLTDSFPRMNNTDSSPRAIRRRRLYAVFEIIMVSGIVSSFMVSLVFAMVFFIMFGRARLNIMEMDISFLVAYTLFESAVAFLILFMLMKARGETLSMLGLRRQQWKTNVVFGILAALCLLVVSGATGVLFKIFLPEYALEKNPLIEMVHSPRQLILFIFTLIVAGGIKEEMQRAFILRRFSHHLGGAGIGLVIWSLAFGAGHSAQGLQGMCTAAILGLIFGALYLMSGNLLLPITAHALYNTMTLLLYWFTIGINKQIP